MALSSAIAPETRSHRAPRRPPGCLAGSTILLVDDDADVLSMLAMKLESEGAATHTAERAQDALALLRLYTPDVIVSDLVLPNIDGFAFLRAVRSDPDLQRTPAIAITGHAVHTARMAAKDAGFDRLFGKPLHVEEIVDEIVRMIGLRRRGGGL
jgi:CheY-like chemotaxis protein